ncbi:MAG: hypothetical protein RBR66_01240 [Candidatus Izemoplasmatales bacterium]|jgi:hypothetical protein|nr:hypothetical protein [Candidatus Izemoplasmatales bacterium]
MDVFKRNNLIYSTLLVLGITVFIFSLSLLAKNSDVFIFWGNEAREAEALIANINIRNTDNFNWTFIFIFTVVVYIYFQEIKNKNYRGIAAGLALYGVHWLYEIINAIIQSSSGFALWTVSAESTSFMLLIGVSWELSMMFAIAGLIMSKLLPEDKNLKILGINNRIFFAIMNAAFFSVFEIFLAGTPAFIWTYSWWGSIPVFITTYIPFFLAAFLIYDAKNKKKIIFIASVWALVFLLLVTLIPLGII